MKLIILSITQYKEKDGIITAISENETVTFKVNRLLDPKSSGHILNMPLIEADVTFSENNHKYQTFKNGGVSFSPYSANDSLTKLSILSLIQEATTRMLQDEEKYFIYKILKRTLIDIKNSQINPIILGIGYLLDLLQITGNELEFNQCVFCGSQKDIVNFSFSDGGFVCRACSEPNLVPALTTTQMKLFRAINRNKSECKEIIGCDEKDLIEILKQLTIYIYDSLGIKLKSANLIF